jgi:PAT family beta-lactamase induction signal transducer AmpG
MAARRPHPVVFLVLIVPYGVVSGYLSVTVAWMLSRHGITVEQVAALVGASFAPHLWKFLWAPVADAMFRRKTWHLAGAIGSAAGVVAMGALPMTPDRLPVLTLVVVAANLATTFVCMGSESLMAHAVPEAEQGRAGGWFQAGYLGGAGLGGGAGLWLAQHSGQAWISGVAMGAVCLASAGALVFVDEPAELGGAAAGLVRRFGLVFRDNWEMIRARAGFLALLLAAMPIGSGAAGQLWASVADGWHAGPDTVALVTGVFSGLVSAAGCLAGGWLSDRMSRKGSYLLYGALQAACVLAMAFGPRTAAAYVAWTSAYAFVTGLTYAGFTAYVLEAMGTGAAATKYNLIASLSNFPIVYVTAIDGHAHTRWGPTGMLAAEAVTSAAGLVIFATAWAAANRWWPGPARARPANALAVPAVPVE